MLERAWRFEFSRPQPLNPEGNTSGFFSAFSLYVIHRRSILGSILQLHDGIRRIWAASRRSLITSILVFSPDCHGADYSAINGLWIVVLALSSILQRYGWHHMRYLFHSIILYIFRYILYSAAMSCNGFRFLMDENNCLDNKELCEILFAY